MIDYQGFAIVQLKVDPWNFWNLTYQEFWFLSLRFHYEIKDKIRENDDKLFFHGDLKAHIANFTVEFKKQGGGEWTYKDFVRLSGESDKKEEKKKLTLKEARQSLGSTFKLNQN